jgi:hypothetical protein
MGVCPRRHQIDEPQHRWRPDSRRESLQGPAHRSTNLRKHLRYERRRRCDRSVWLSCSHTHVLCHWYVLVLIDVSGRLDAIDKAVHVGGGCLISLIRSKGASLTGIDVRELWFFGNARPPARGFLLRTNPYAGGGSRPGRTIRSDASEASPDACEELVASKGDHRCSSSMHRSLSVTRARPFVE